jgi:outer membrane murein-binding lipoprotein Lpp
MNIFRLVALALSAILLSSCDLEDRIDDADTNARNALARVQVLESQISELERKVRNLETDMIIRR